MYKNESKLLAKDLSIFLSVTTLVPCPTSLPDNIHTLTMANIGQHCPVIHYAVEVLYFNWKAFMSQKRYR